MYLTVFGNNASFPRAYGACACYLVEACGKKVLLDMGSGSLSQLQRTEDLAALDMIVVSHLHFDHMGDLFCAKYQLETRRAWGETVPKIPLLAPPMPQWARQELGAGEVFDICEVGDGACFTLGGIRLTFIRLEHLVESYGLRLCTGQKTLAYARNCRHLQRAPMSFCARQPLPGAAGPSRATTYLQRPRAFLLPSTMQSGCC